MSLVPRTGQPHRMVPPCDCDDCVSTMPLHEIAGNSAGPPVLDPIARTAPGGGGQLTIPQWAIDAGFPTDKWGDFDWDRPGAFTLLAQGYRRCEVCGFWVRADADNPWVECAGCTAEEEARCRHIEADPNGHCVRCEAPLSDEEKEDEADDDGRWWCAPCLAQDYYDNCVWPDYQ